MSEAKRIDVFEVVAFPNLTPEKEALKKKLADANYSCAKTFTLKEVASMFQEKDIIDLLNCFSSSITDETGKELLNYIGNTVIDFMERSYLHKEYESQYQIISSLVAGSLTESDVEGISKELKVKFGDCSSYRFHSTVEKNIEKAVSVLIGLYSKENRIYTVRATDWLLFKEHDHKLPIHLRLSKDAKAFAKGELIDINKYYQDIYNIVTK